MPVGIEGMNKNNIFNLSKINNSLQPNKIIYLKEKIHTGSFAWPRNLEFRVQTPTSVAAMDKNDSL
jgi:hypothetical protein